MKKKLLIVLLSIMSAVTCAFGMSACFTIPVDSGNSGNQSEEEGNGNTVEPSASFTYQELITEYLPQVKTFFEEKIKRQIVENRTVRAESWYLLDQDNDDNIDGVSLSYIYESGQDMVLEVATATLVNPISATDIYSGYSEDVSLEIYREEIFTFNEYENAVNNDVVLALYRAAYVTNEVKLYNEAEEDEIDRIFNIVNIGEKKISVINLNVTKGDKSNETIIKNLTNRAEYAYRTTKTVTIDGDLIYEKAFEIDMIEPVVPPVEDPDDTESEQPDDPPAEEEIPVTNADVLNFLNEYCFEGVIEACHWRSDEWVYDGKWYVVKDADCNIVEASYLHIYRYSDKETQSYYYVGKVEFENPININNFTEEDLQGATYTKAYSTSNFDQTIQGDKFISGFNMDSNVDMELVYEKLFGEQQDGAVRVCTESSHNIAGTTSSHCFGKKYNDWGKNIAGVVWTIYCFEVTDSYIKTGTMCVCRDQIGASDYKQLFYKYVNGGYYRTIITDKYDISGERVPDNDELFVYQPTNGESVLTDEQIYDALNNYYYSDVMADYRPQAAANSKWFNDVPAYGDKTGLLSGEWYITRDNGGNLTKAEYVFDYKGYAYNTWLLKWNDSENIYTYKCVYSLQFSSPFNYDDYENLKQGEKKSVACYSEFSMLSSGGRPYTKQYESLCNTICETLIGDTTDADIYLCISVSGVDTGACAISGTNAAGEVYLNYEADTLELVFIQDKTFINIRVNVVQPSVALGSYEANFNAGYYGKSFISYPQTYIITGELLKV